MSRKFENIFYMKKKNRLEVIRLGDVVLCYGLFTPGWGSWCTGWHYGNTALLSPAIFHFPGKRVLIMTGERERKQLRGRGSGKARGDES